MIYDGPGESEEHYKAMRLAKAEVLLKDAERLLRAVQKPVYQATADAIEAWRKSGEE